MRNSISRYGSDQPVIEEVKKINERFKANRFNRPPSVKNTIIGSGDFTINSGTYTNVRMTLTNAVSGNILAIMPPEISIQRSQTDLYADSYPYGANWTGSEVGNIRIEYFPNLAETDGTNVVCQLIIKNGSTTNFNMRVRVRWRVFVEEVTVT